jgi:hypothetical protein
MGFALVVIGIVLMVVGYFIIGLILLILGLIIGFGAPGPYGVRGRRG